MSQRDCKNSKDVYYHDGKTAAKYPPANSPPPPPYSSPPAAYSKPTKIVFGLPPPTYQFSTAKINSKINSGCGTSTALHQELEKGERVSIRSPNPKKLIFYPRLSSQKDVLDTSNCFMDGEIGSISDKYCGSNEVLYCVELPRGAKGWVSRKCVERHKPIHKTDPMTLFSPIDTDGSNPMALVSPIDTTTKSSDSLSMLQMRINKLERQKYEAVALHDFKSAQRIKETIIALKEERRRQKNSKKNADGHGSMAKPQNSVHVFGTSVDKFEPRKFQSVAPQDLVVGHEIRDQSSGSDTLDPQVSFDDGKSWQSFPVNHLQRIHGRRASVLTRGVVFNLGFGSFAISEFMGGRHALQMNGFELEYCKLTPKEMKRYDNHIYETHARKNLYDYAREKIVPMIRRLAKQGRCPVALFAGSRGGQETLQYVWRHCYRGPTVCLNSSCITTSFAELHAYRGVHYTMANAPRSIPLVVTSSDNDEIGFRPKLADELLELYRSRGHPHLLAQYHCSSDSHVPESVPRRLGLLVRLAVGLSTCTNIPAACAQASVEDLVRSLKSFSKKTSFVVVGGVKRR